MLAKKNPQLSGDVWVELPGDGNKTTPYNVWSNSRADYVPVVSHM